MAKLVKLVAGGYEVKETGEVIPAGNLIPFGRLHSFPGSTRVKTKVNTKIGGNSLDGLNEEIGEAASEYADSMQSPYYDLAFEVQVHPGGFSGTSLKKATVVRSSEIQLYVENPLVSRG